MDVVSYVLAKRYTDAKIAEIETKAGRVEYRVVSELPQEGEDGIVYLIYVGDSGHPSLYDEYVWTEGEWVKLASQTISDLIQRGYYYGGVFWKDAGHNTRLPDKIDNIYLDLDSNLLYYYSTETQQYSQMVSLATSQKAGLVKLYGDSGDNTDGAMTQKAVTTKLKNKVELDTSSLDEECLGFSLNIA